MRPRTLLSLAVAGLVGTAAGAVPAQGAVDREAALERLQAEIAGLEGELEKVGRSRSGVEAELRRLDLEVGRQEHLVRAARLRRELAEDALTESERRLGQLEMERDATRSRLARRLAALLRVTAVDWLKAFVTVKSPADLFGQVRALRWLARRDALLLRHVRRLQAELVATRERLERDRTDVAAALQRERGRLDELRDARRRQDLVAQALVRERQRLARRTRALGERERRLALLIAAAVGQAEAPLGGPPIQSFRGVLDWPVDGTVSVPFGPRRDPRYGTQVPHNGVTVETVPGTPVRAVYAGAVIFAAEFEDFGRTVVVHHPEQVFSLYSGLDRLLVERGDVVALDTVLGTVSARLYFEIRVENDPRDPQEWLQ